MVKPCVLLRRSYWFLFWALCFLSARNDTDSKYKELCNCCADQIRIQGLLPVPPTTGYQRNRQTKEWIMWGQCRQAYTQTRAIGRALPPWTTCFPRRGCSSAGTKLLEVLSTVPLLRRLHVVSRNPRGAGSWMNSKEAGQSRSWNTCMACRFHMYYMNCRYIQFIWRYLQFIWRYLQFNWIYLQIDLFEDIYNSFGDIYNSFGDISKYVLFRDISNSIADICNSI